MRHEMCHLISHIRHMKCVSNAAHNNKPNSRSQHSQEYSNPHWHSFLCIMTSTFVCTFDPKINGFPALIVKHVYIKFVDPNCISFGDILWKNRQTNKHTNASENITQAAAVGVGNNLVQWCTPWKKLDLRCRKSKQNSILPKASIHYRVKELHDEERHRTVVLFVSWLCAVAGQVCQRPRQHPVLPTLHPSLHVSFLGSAEDLWQVPANADDLQNI